MFEIIGNRGKIEFKRNSLVSVYFFTSIWGKKLIMEEDYDKRC